MRTLFRNGLVNGGMALAMALASSCAKERAEGSTRSVATPAVVVKPVGLESITQRLELTGDVRPLSTVQLASKVPGRLERLGRESEGGPYIPLTEGTLVRRGDVLAQIDRAVYRARLDQAEAASALAEAQREEAAREEQRAKALFEEGSATQQMLDKAVTARKMAEAACAQAEAALALARIEFDEAAPRAPLDGVVTRKHVDEGNLVSVGMPLVTIEALEQVKVVFSVPERYLPSIVPGETKARLTAEGLPGGYAEAVVSRVYPAVDPATRTGTLEALVDNADGRFRSGAFVHVTLDVARLEQVVVIPLSAVLWQGKESFVFVVEEGRARRRSVQIGLREGERCQVVEGLRPGELLVVEGWRDLRDGDAVAVREESAS